MHMASIPEGWQWVRFCHSSWAFVLSSGTGIRSDISDTVYLLSAVTFWIEKVTPLIFSLFFGVRKGMRSLLPTPPVFV